MGKSLEQRVAELEKKIQKIEGNKTIRINKILSIGDIFELSGVEWKILDITNKGYVCLANILGKNMKFDSNINDWRSSDLREYLNGEFLEKISETIGEDNIIPFKRDLRSLDGQTEYGTCEDKISLLTVDEYRKYRKLIPNAGNWFWLITPWSTPCNDDKTFVAVVSPSGKFSNYGCDLNFGVRPVCIFSSVIFESEE